MLALAGEQRGICDGGGGGMGVHAIPKSLLKKYF